MFEADYPPAGLGEAAAADKARLKEAQAILLRVQAAAKRQTAGQSTLDRYTPWPWGAPGQRYSYCLSE